MREKDALKKVREKRAALLKENAAPAKYTC